MTESTETTRELLRTASVNLPWHDTADFDDATRGFIARRAERQIRNAEGRVVWDFDASEFLTQRHPTPPTRACGARVNCSSRTGCSRWCRASTNYAASTCP
jgi:alkyl sulfatase BDS1-like metallo-beta-lactamase superfamily hydrolase